MCLLDLFLSLMVDHDIFHKYVWNEEGVFIIDWAIQRISHWEVVHITVARANTSRNSGIVGVLQWLVWVHSHDDLELHTFWFALWQHEASWELVVCFSHVQMEFFLTLQCFQDVLECLTSGCAVLSSVRLTGVTLNQVLSSSQLVVELIHLDKVHPVVFHVHMVTHLIVFWTDEDLDHHFHVFLGGGSDLHGEGFVIQAHLTNMNLEFTSCIKEFFLSEVQSVGHFPCVMIHKSDELIEIYFFDLDSWKHELFVLVVWEMPLVVKEFVEDPLVELEEDWITHACFEVLHGAWDYLVFIMWVWRITKDFVSNSLENSVEAGVGRVTTFDDFAEHVEAVLRVQVNLGSIFSEHSSEVNSITDSSFEIFNFSKPEHVVIVTLMMLIVGVVHKVNPCGPGWEFKSIVIAHGWYKSSLDWLFPVENVDASMVVGQSF